MFLICRSEDDLIGFARGGGQRRRHLDELKWELDHLAIWWPVGSIARNPFQSLDKWAANVRFIDNQQTVLRDQRGMNRTRLIADAVATKQKSRPHLIDRAADDHWLKQRSRPSPISINASAKLSTRERSRVARTSERTQRRCHLAHDRTRRRFAEFAAKFPGSQVGLVHDNAAVNDEEYSAPRGTVSQREACLHRKGKDRSVQAGRFSTSGRCRHILRPIPSAEPSREFLLPRKWIPVFPNLPEEGGELVRREGWLAHVREKPNGLQTP